jgi:hypothetical protein
MSVSKPALHFAVNEVEQLGRPPVPVAPRACKDRARTKKKPLPSWPLGLRAASIYRDHAMETASRDAALRHLDRGDAEAARLELERGRSAGVAVDTHLREFGEAPAASVKVPASYALMRMWRREARGQ